MGALSARRSPVGVAAAALLALTACGPRAAAGDEPLDVVLPALAGVDQEATELDLGELDEPLLVNFWATWCPPCRTELPGLQRAAEERPDVRFVGIDEGFDEAESVDFLDEVGVTYEQFLDVDGELATELELVELPTTVLLDADGEVLWTYSGPIVHSNVLAVLRVEVGPGSG